MLLTGAEISQLSDLLKDLPVAPVPPWAGEPFGGFLVSHDSAECWNDIPPLLRVFRGVIRIDASFFIDGKGLEGWLEQRFQGRLRSDPGGPTRFWSRQGPPFAPDSWNAPDPLPDVNTAPLDVLRDAVKRIRTQLGNNCYNYACNSPTGTFAQPGKKGGRPIDWDQEDLCAEVIQAAEKDNLIPLIDCFLECDPALGRKVMLFVDAEDDPDQPGDDRDFHWYRQDADGNWSHKPGQGRATNEDDGEPPPPNVIANPWQADTDTRRDDDDDGKYDRGYDYEFCACFCVPPGLEV